MTSTLLLLALVVPGCSPSVPEGRVVIDPSTLSAEPTAPPSPGQTHPLAGNVLLVINSTSNDSKEIGAYYRAKRGIPSANVVMVSVTEQEEISTAAYTSGILQPVRKAIDASKTRIDYIVLTKGLPIRLDNGNGFSVDGHLATMRMDLKPIQDLTEAEIRRCANPYFGSTQRFRSDRFNMYLVTRLTGYTASDAKKLVDNALAAKKVDGPFYFDQAGNRKSGGYKVMQDTLGAAHRLMQQRGFKSTLETTDTFGKPDGPVMGYASWGSNDGKFDEGVYRSIKFLPGALSETFVSTSGRTFNRTTGGQSLVADLIASGVTGVKGYVSEPYTFALARPEVLFDRYTGGMNLAESFYNASQVIKWKDIVIGDPLCRPYGTD